MYKSIEMTMYSHQGHIFFLGLHEPFPIIHLSHSYISTNYNQINHCLNLILDYLNISEFR
jgi:hypothetical protein